MREGNKLFLIIFIILSCDFFIFPSNDETLLLTLNDTVLLALQNNLNIKIKNIDLQNKKLDMATSWNIFLPSVVLNGSIMTVNQNALEGMRDDIKRDYINKYDEKLTDEDVYKTYDWKKVSKGSVKTNLKINIDLNASQIFKIKKVVNDWRNGKILFDIAKADLIKNVKINYIDLLLLDENYNMIKNELSSTKLLYEAILSKYENGFATEVEVTIALYKYEKLKIDLIEIENQYEEILLDFKNIIGLKENISIKLITDLSSLSYYEIIDDKILLKYINNNLDLKMSNLDLDNIKNTLNTNIANLTPSISLSYLFDPTLRKSDPFGNDSLWFDNVQDDWKQKNGNFTFTISLLLDMFVPFSNQQVKIVQSVNNIKIQKMILENERETLLIELVKKIRMLNKYSKLLKPIDINLELANKTLKITEELYKNGNKSFLELEDAQNNYNEARLKLIETRNNYYKIFFEIEYLLNVDLEKILKN